jgi:hypothetical protein
MQDKSQFPPIDKALILALDKLFPNESADINLLEKYIWYKSGQVSVVNFLKRKFDEQNETIIEDK